METQEFDKFFVKNLDFCQILRKNWKSSTAKKLKIVEVSLGKTQNHDVTKSIYSWGKKKLCLREKEKKNSVSQQKNFLRLSPPEIGGWHIGFKKITFSNTHFLLFVEQNPPNAIFWLFHVSPSGESISRAERPGR